MEFQWIETILIAEGWFRTQVFKFRMVQCILNCHLFSYGRMEFHIESISYTDEEIHICFSLKLQRGKISKLPRSIRIPF